MLGDWRWGEGGRGRGMETETETRLGRTLMSVRGGEVKFW